ncbi:twin-arginine translocation pathway signal protein [Oceanicella sp. SM1341]|uniref:twin-arginine translocation pathway signal protein n=1 Tax=Oceanicella sp. SM1341 TaxID=1548889 RepID=UPI000E532057|nr:twin-arginine translocation pathway signal protein [Oceanicella sp. SM1341]
MTRKTDDTSISPGTSRRDLLRLGLAGIPAVAVGSVAGTGAAQAAEEVAPTSLGLRKTEHVLKYYETCR